MPTVVAAGMLRCIRHRAWTRPYRRHDGGVFVGVRHHRTQWRRSETRTARTGKAALERLIARARRAAHACKMGLEGIVSKRKDSHYRSGRSPHWIKSKNPENEVEPKMPEARKAQATLPGIRLQSRFERPSSNFATQKELQAHAAQAGKVCRSEGIANVSGCSRQRLPTTDSVMEPQKFTVRVFPPESGWWRGVWTAVGPVLPSKGTVKPKYKVLLVAYVPPGTNLGARGSSSVVYEGGSTAGSSTSVSNTFKQSSRFLPTPARGSSAIRAPSV
jgi:hypothetical protein